MITGRRYAVAIVGDSLCARLAAALLAKHGSRIIRFQAPLNRDPWLHASHFAEQLLTALGGRDRLGPALPFQVLSSRARVTIAPQIPLSEELAREFAGAAEPVAALLEHFEQLGQQLEDCLWEYGGLPGAGIRETARWRWRCLQRKLPLTALADPLTRHLGALPAPAGEWLRDLFQGLALQSVETLTVADAATLWANARRPAGLAADTLDRLLDKRFEQFHGLTAELDSLESLRHQEGHWQGKLQGGGRFQAQHLLLADTNCRLPGIDPPLPASSRVPARHFATTSLAGRISTLLAARVVAGGPLPLRLSIDTDNNGGTALISCIEPADGNQIRRQLEPVLPFASFTLEPTDNRPPAPGQGNGPTQGLWFTGVRLPCATHCWCADERRLLPHLGFGGAAVLAWTLVRQLEPAALPMVG